MTKRQRIETLIATYKVTMPKKNLESFILHIVAIWELEETPPEPLMFVRASSENSVCIYCQTKIGKAMKCPGCGVIDPPATTS